jgi:hypothetical protein
MAIPRSKIEDLIHTLAAGTAENVRFLEGDDAFVDAYIRVSENLREKFEAKAEIDESK